MDKVTYNDYYMNPISLEKEAQETFLPHLYKDISVIKISPEEQVTEITKKKSGIIIEWLRLKKGLLRRFLKKKKI